MSFNAIELSQRFKLLDANSRKAFLSKLAMAGVNFNELPIIPADRKNILSISYAQQSLWLTWQLDPQSAAYNIPGIIRLSGVLDSALLADVLFFLQMRHDTLHHCINGNTEPPSLKKVVIPRLDLIDLSDSVMAESLAMNQAEIFVKQAFDLDKEAPFRAQLYKISMHEYLLAISIHHIAADGWSLGIVIDELVQSYDAVVEKLPSPLKPLEINHCDYSIWQRLCLDAGEADRQLAYWQSTLGNEHPVLALPYDHPECLGEAHPQSEYLINLSTELSSQLRQLAKEHNASLYMVILALFSWGLNKFTGQYDIRIGSPVANRQLSESQSLVAYLSNILVLRTCLDESLGFDSLLSSVRETVLEAQAHADMPFDVLVRHLQPDRHLGIHPLFQVKCTEQADRAFPAQMGKVQLQLSGVNAGSTHFDLSLDFVDASNGIELNFIFAADLFNQATIENFASVFQTLALQAVKTPKLALGESQIGAPAIFLPPIQGDATVIALWQQKVAQHPHAAAIQFEEQQYSFQELDLHSDYLAAKLIENGVRNGSRVAIHAERSCEFVLGMLAALKAGACYVPLDPQLPIERLQYQLQDSQANFLLSKTPVAWAEETAQLALNFDQSIKSSNIALPIIHPQQAAYLIYTSGSTGQPKGVVVPHSALANYVQSILIEMALNDDVKSMAMISTVAADLGHTTLYGALCSGRLLHLISAECAFDPDRFANYMSSNQVDILKIVPSHLQALLHAANPGNVLPQHCLIVGGEATSWLLLDKITQLKPQCLVLNHYGPSETTVGVLTQSADQADRSAKYLPLGRALPGIKSYVLDSSLQIVPQGIAGELYLSGVGLANGYLNRKELTAERFIANPFGSGERMYRSGDRVRTLADGSLAFLGRTDDQIKIRGYRVEPDEVAAVLLKLNGVSAAFVIAESLDDGRNQLLAYVVADTSIEEIKFELVKRLPDYMVPASIIQLSQLPLNANGKIDRKALPKTTEVGVNVFAAPQGDKEILIANIWETLLNKNKIGRDDNFFDLGGDSIISLQIVARLRRAGYKLAPRLIFEKQTVAHLANEIQEIKGAKPSASLLFSIEKFNLLPIQSHFLLQESIKANHRNQAVLLQSREPLNVAALTAALGALLQQHDALRLRYTFDETSSGTGRWTQSYAAFDGQMAADCLWQHQAANEAELTAHCNVAQRSLDLVSGPLLRAVLFDIADDDSASPSPSSQRLLLAIHHLVVDGVSWRVLLEDLQLAYQQAASGSAIVLPAKTSSYQAWGAALATYPQQYAAELAHWQAQVAQPLTCDDPQGERSGVYQASVAVELDTTATQALLQQVPAAYRTQINDVLLTALGRALCQWSGREQVLIDLEGHGREDLYSRIDLSRSVGWFTSLFPVRLNPLGEIGSALKRVKEDLRSIPNKGLGFGAFKYLGSAEQRAALADVPSAAVVFNYLGQFEGSFSGDALWSVAKEDSGDAVDPAALMEHELSINGQIHGGRLSLSIAYSSQRWQAQSINTLAQAFQSELEELIAHCCSGVKGLTPSDLPLAQLNQHDIDSLPLDIAQLADLYPLSPMQAGMLFHSVFEPQAGAYLNQLRVDIRGLDAERFQAAWQAVFVRHDVLRTGFLHQRDVPLQWVAKQVALPWESLDWREQAASEELSLALDTLAREELEQGFVLEQAPLTRLLLVRTGEQQHHFIWTNHHLLTDGWSTSQLMGDVLRAYQGEVLGTPLGRYRDYIAWLQSRDAAASESWWKQQLAALEAPTRLVGSLAKPPVDTGYAEQAVSLDAAQTQALHAFAKRERVTVNTVVQAAWALLLSRYTGQRTVCFGATTSGRPTELAGAEQIQGMFINTLPVICAIEADLGVGDWLRNLQSQNLAAREHEHTPLYEIQRWAGTSGQVLFDSIVVFENYPIDEALKNAAPSATTFELLANREQTNYPLTLAFSLADTLQAHASFDRSLLAVEQVAQILTQWQQVLQTLVQAGAGIDGQVEPALSHVVGNVQLLNIAEQTELQTLGTNPQRFDASQLVHRLIETQVAQRPGATALIFGEVELNYAELNQRANQLAHYLIANGVGLESKVGIALERSVEMVVALLAVLKAGGAYVPLDPEYPQDRLGYMVADSGINALMTHTSLIQRIPSANSQVITLDTLDLSTQSTQNPDVAIHGNNLAYVIYTSGSTGKPKGAANRHCALYNRLAWMQGAYQLDRSDTVLQKTPFSFDVSVWEFFWPLMFGARLVLAQPGDHRDPARLSALIQAVQVTTLHFVPSMLQAFVAHAGVNECTSIRRVICSGEALAAEVQAELLTLLPHTQLYNLYGPTEAAIDVTHFTCDGDSTRSVAIGRPIADTQTHVLDAEFNLVPQGTAGELYLGGIGLARGYLNRAELTSERFVADPFDQNGGRLYRTGDLVRWRADGQLEYLGRLDHQVKIRGFRIELGEIEAQLLAQEAVREAVVVAQEGSGGVRLVGYVSPQAGVKLDTAQLKAAIAAVLPDYMVPSILVALEALPLNPNGKVDRKALPKPELASQSYEAPQGEIEMTLAQIWAGVLGIEQVGRSDNFFELGGHSLLAMQLTARVQKEFKISANVLDIFQASNVMLYAQRVLERQPATQSMDSLEAFIDSLEV
ncbi:non-ribosomal peptide synthetase [Deefgea rivuli]|uniref:non-ribosomal peptide synthetase n=1 Tax=Deefgea rivuli TaxID=400948 RepID=UPI000489D523|nr:non-ribosomal peptide synthetase [Deefgea rivuli]